MQPEGNDKEAQVEESRARISVWSVIAVVLYVFLALVVAFILFVTGAIVAEDLTGDRQIAPWSVGIPAGLISLWLFWWIPRKWRRVGAKPAPFREWSSIALVLYLWLAFAVSFGISIFVAAIASLFVYSDTVTLGIVILAWILSLWMFRWIPGRLQRGQARDVQNAFAIIQALFLAISLFCFWYIVGIVDAFIVFQGHEPPKPYQWMSRLQPSPNTPAAVLLPVSFAGTYLLISLLLLRRKKASTGDRAIHSSIALFFWSLVAAYASIHLFTVALCFVSMNWTLMVPDFGSDVASDEVSISIAVSNSIWNTPFGVGGLIIYIVMLVLFWVTETGKSRSENLDETASSRQI